MSGRGAAVASGRFKAWLLTDPQRFDATTMLLRTGTYGSDRRLIADGGYDTPDVVRTAEEVAALLPRSERILIKSFDTDLWYTAESGALALDAQQGRKDP